MNECKFNPEDNWENVGKAIQCPSCKHLIILGLPHPDFNSAELPISEGALTELSSLPLGIGGCMGDSLD